MQLNSSRRRFFQAFTLVELMAVVAIIGILASVAIPAFKKYLVKSKTTEVSLNIQKIFGGEVTYYTEEHVDTTGSVLPKQFVQEITTPPLANIGINKVLGDFSTPEWEAIKFGTDSAVNFSYTVDTLGIDTTAIFTVRGQGDLNGNGVTSLFERVASIAPGGDVLGGSGIYSIDELE